MANEDSPQAAGQPQWHGGNAPGLAGVYGRLRITVAGKPFATLAVEGTYVVLLPDTSGPADATLLCADEEIMRKLLKGDLNPYIASMRRQARLARRPRLRDARDARLAGRIALRGRRRQRSAVMSLDTVSILDGSTFVVSDRRGDFDASPTETHGLFLEDTRFLSRWILTVGGIRPKTLSVDEQTYFKVQFFEAVTTGTIYVDSHLSVMRQRCVSAGFEETIEIENHGKEPVELDVKLEVGRRLRRSVRGEGQDGQGRPALHATSTTGR